MGVIKGTVYHVSFVGFVLPPSNTPSHVYYSAEHILIEYVPYSRNYIIGFFFKFVGVVFVSAFT